MSEGVSYLRLTQALINSDAGVQNLDRVFMVYSLISR